jgi:DNA-binding response OmpR family regulator
MLKDPSVRVVFPGSSAHPVLVESDPMRLAQLHRGLRDAGIDVVAAGRIADIEQWPSDTFVITDIDHFTPWWREVGATNVIVLADTREQGLAACQRGATKWLRHNCTVPELLAAIDSVLIREKKADVRDRHGLVDH